MEKILAQYWAICILKIGPQDLPASRFLAVVTSAVYILLSIVFYLSQLSVLSAIGAGVVDFALMAGLSYLILWVRLLGSRWLQTLTALMGSGVILTAIGLIVEYGLSFLPLGTVGKDFFRILMLAQLGWSAAIVTHILRHALTVSLLLAVAFTVVYIYIAWNVIRALFFVVLE